MEFMVSTQKLQMLILPALILTALGMLQILFPHALSAYVIDIPEKRGGFILLILEAFLVLTWGKVEGTILILMALGLMSLCFFSSDDEPEPEPTIKRKATVAATKMAWVAGKQYFVHRREKRKSLQSLSDESDDRSSEN
ncbi:hypothetical protein [Leptolyngbya sp. CCY15150]|uniref:hypothetical protein n=1 Tax=Leptolyngbya sp. CCY15150 TaxID=2767772 RepID=UPI001950CE6C|nr:hypothetical protein [Leptolyngbya sp. CCY15150]